MEKKRKDRKRKRTETIEDCENETKIVKSKFEAHNLSRLINSPVFLDNTNDENETEQIIIEDPVVQPLEIDNKPFNIKKFRDNLKKNECLLGKYFVKIKFKMENRNDTNKYLL